MAERPWEKLLADGLGDAWERTQDDATSLVAEVVEWWPDVLKDEARWSSAASLVLALLGEDPTVHTLLYGLIDSLYPASSSASPDSSAQVSPTGSGTLDTSQDRFAQDRPLSEVHGPPCSSNTDLGPCHVTACENEAVGGEVGEGGDLLLCSEHLRPTTGPTPGDPRG